MAALNLAVLLWTSRFDEAMLDAGRFDGELNASGNSEPLSHCSFFIGTAARAVVERGVLEHLLTFEFDDLHIDLNAIARRLCSKSFNCFGLRFVREDGDADVGKDALNRLRVHPNLCTRSSQIHVRVEPPAVPQTRDTRQSEVPTGRTLSVLLRVIHDSFRAHVKWSSDLM
jgi:hypothetical protein